MKCERENVQSPKKRFPHMVVRRRAIPVATRQIFTAQIFASHPSPRSKRLLARLARDSVESDRRHLVDLFQLFIFRWLVRADIPAGRSPSRRPKPGPDDRRRYSSGWESRPRLRRDWSPPTRRGVDPSVLDSDLSRRLSPPPAQRVSPRLPFHFQSAISGRSRPFSSM